MPAAVLRNLYIIAENSLDVSILRTILDCKSFQNVYDYGIEGYRNMANVCRTLRLMIDYPDKILIAFDTQTINQEIILDLLSNMMYLTKADVSQVKIGLFPMAPNLNTVIGIDEKIKGNMECLKDFLRSNMDQIKSSQVFSDMQAFLDFEE